ncbi:MAG: UDP-N-acetylmuramate dehydrogenase [Nitrospinae bacterium]|nr:UDP-N-acetylmuramate dehydrogenase [Nitrospinota bacterium]
MNIEHRTSNVEVERLRREKIRFKANEPLAPYTSFKVGGKADLMLWAEDDGQLRRSLEFAGEKGLPARVIGRGSNILVSDQGIRGVVILLDGNYRKKTLLKNGEKSKEIEAGAGVVLSGLAAFALKHGLTGMECLAGIPGTLGGALLMNAGAGGREIASLVESVRVMDMEGRARNLSREEIKFGYRWSSLRDMGIILGAKLKLAAGEAGEILKKMKEHLQWRKNSQPLEFPSAGSVFKNPPGDCAGRLIESAGLKGTRAGGAEISRKHANFIVNTGGARASDIQELIDMARKKVMEKFGINLELEIQIMN